MSRLLESVQEMLAPTSWKEPDGHVGSTAGVMATTALLAMVPGLPVTVTSISEPTVGVEGE